MSCDRGCCLLQCRTGSQNADRCHDEVDNGCYTKAFLRLTIEERCYLKMMNNLLGVYTYTIKSRIPLKGPISNPEAFAFNIDTFYIQFIFLQLRNKHCLLTDRFEKIKVSKAFQIWRSRDLKKKLHFLKLFSLS